MLATTKPNQDGQDFELFITVKPIPDFSDKFIVFGRVLRGEDVIQAVKVFYFSIISYLEMSLLNNFAPYFPQPLFALVT